jgi:hypothetical protein
MSDENVSRRAALKLLGVGVAGAAVTGAQKVEALPAAPPAPVATDLPGLDPSARLVAPLAPGSRLGRWRIERVLPLTDGATSVVLSDAAGAMFQLDICRRDPEPVSPRGPGVCERFEIFLANGGNGSTGTHEDHGLAAMALSEVVRGNESSVSTEHFLTLKERVAADRARVHVG